MSKNVAVFVDVANIFYAAKAAGADIDYVTLLKAAVAGRDFVRAYAYTGLDPENENQRNFHSFLARHGYKVVSKDIRKYGDGKVKANLDIELVVDMMKTARNLDVAIVVSGDGDFAPAIRAVQEMGVRVEVISFRGNTSSDLIDVADVFYDITQVAKVDRDSSRSGRRVADDEEDLSMTEVPDKQTEGRGGRRTRGGRRSQPIEEAAVDGRRSGGRGRGGRTEPVAARAVDVRAVDVRAGDSRGGLVALPGERLSKVPPQAAEGEPAEEEPIEEGAEGQVASVEGAVETEQGRRRRRRGGRGRGHGRGQDSFGEPVEAGAEAEAETEAAEFEEVEPAAPVNRPNQFGSVWDSQIGMAGRPERLAPVTPDEDDFAEPEIPEYLLAERRRGGRGRGGPGQGGRGVRSAYASAVERERFGRSGGSRYPEPVRSPQPQRGPRRDERPDRPQRQPQPQQQQRRGGGSQRPGGGRESSEPWSEVPPEIEELLRAQLSAKLSRPAGEAAAETATAGRQAGQGGEPTSAGEQPAASTARRGGRRKAAEGASEAAVPTMAEAAPSESAPAAAPSARAPRRTRSAPSAASASRAAEQAGTAASSEAAGTAEPIAAPKPRTRRKAASAEGAPSDAAVAAEAAPAGEAQAPKKRTVRRKAAEPAGESSESGSGEPVA